MKDIKTDFSETRRQVITSLGVGAISAIAGCSSNQGDNASQSTATSTPPPTATSTSSSTSSPQDSSSTSPDQTKTDTASEGGSDTRYNDPNQTQNETNVEGFLDDSGYKWVEIERIDANIQLPDSASQEHEESKSHAYLVSWLHETIHMEFSENEHVDWEGDVQTVYIAFQEFDGGGDNEYGVLTPQIFEEGYDEQRGGAFFKKEAVEQLLKENISGISDASENMPQEYLELVQ